MALGGSGRAPIAGDALKKRYTAKGLTRTELGSLVICEDKELLYEEAPQPYKNISVVIEDLVRARLAEVIGILRPLITYKSTAMIRHKPHGSGRHAMPCGGLWVNRLSLPQQSSGVSRLLP
jgi:hypothetical protein